MFEIMRSKKKRKRESNAIRSEDVPVTVGHLNSFKNEILTTINQKFSERDGRLLSFEHQVEQRFERIDQRLDEVERKFEEVDRRFEQIDQRFNQLEDKIDRRFARLETLILEQNSRNLFVLDGYNDLSARLEKVEKKLKDIPI